MIQAKDKVKKGPETSSLPEGADLDENRKRLNLSVSRDRYLMSASRTQKTKVKNKSLKQQIKNALSSSFEVVLKKIGLGETLPIGKIGTEKTKKPSGRYEESYTTRKRREYFASLEMCRLRYLDFLASLGLVEPPSVAGPTGFKFQ
jgi:hypothetical protein